MANVVALGKTRFSGTMMRSTYVQVQLMSGLFEIKCSSHHMPCSCNHITCISHHLKITDQPHQKFYLHKSSLNFAESFSLVICTHHFQFIIYYMKLIMHIRKIILMLVIPQLIKITQSNYSCYISLSSSTNFCKLSILLTKK